MRLRLPALACLVLFHAAAITDAADPAPQAVDDAIAKAQTWLLAQAQPNGALTKNDKFQLGVTALAVDALAQGPGGVAGDPRIAKALELLWSNQQGDGGIYRPEEGVGNYVTALTLMATEAAGKLDQYKDKVAKAQQYLFGLQNTQAGSPAEGGIGYGSKGAGHEDLSNTSMAVQALRRSGVPQSDPRMQKALEFVQRCQNLSSHNKLPWAQKAEAQDIGGSVYSPEESKAGGSWATEEERKNPDTKMRSYGGMTYALISSYIYLGLKPGDPRLDAALGWIRRNWRFDANPGMAAGKEKQGLFYYYGIVAKTFDQLGAKEVDLGDGKKADWRKDLFAAIMANATAVKTDDGKDALVWINSADRWMEGDPNVTNGYLLRALKRIRANL